MNQQKLKVNYLPLSWFTANSGESKLHTIQLSGGRTIWNALARVSVETDFHELISAPEDAKGLLIRGISPNLAEELETHGFKKYLVSSEAVLDLREDHFSKKSLCELIRRGLRHGSVSEIQRTETNINKLKELLNASSHSKEPQLANLFYQTWEPEFRLFVFEAKSGGWLGALLISPNATTKMHTELILRRATAPVGIMESLVYKTCEQLQSENCQILSLGEVPFKIKSGEKLSGWEKLINFAGNLLNFAYNSKGLFYFKNKFHPKWANTYICVDTKITLWMMIQLSVKTNFLRLIFHKLLK